jgi:serine/threonine protein kinase
MGVVFEAFDRQLGARVALKTLRSTSPDALFRLKHEFRALQGIRHPNLVALGELIEERGHWFFTMELLHGVGFLEHVRPGHGAGLPGPPTEPGMTACRGN